MGCCSSRWQQLHRSCRHCTSSPYSYNTHQTNTSSSQLQGRSTPDCAHHGCREKVHGTSSRIPDHYKSLEQVREALNEAGLESSNLIVGIDFTKSNEWTGKICFDRRCLHHVGDRKNPYEDAISVIGRSWSSYNDDNSILCFGFGDASTHDQQVFSFHSNGRPCNGFEEVLFRYREIAPNLQLDGSTSFAPIIEMAITTVRQGGGKYHILLILADGQVTRSVNTIEGQYSLQEQRTIDAIVQASHYPLSIILVGVGDGPWDMMKTFNDKIRNRRFDNFQFVNFTEIMSKNITQSKKQMEFALAASKKIPSQFKAILRLGLMGRQPPGKFVARFALPPPCKATAPPEPPECHTAPSYSLPYNVCPVCFINRKDMAFGCGHSTCCECSQLLVSCPICRSFIMTRIKLY